MSEQMPFDSYEGDNGVLQLECRRINDGLGFGDGAISTEEMRQKLGEETYHELEQSMDYAITSPEVLVRIEADDDGCGDGRGVLKVFNKDQEFGRSLHRAKVFGGGPAMSAAALIGLGQAQGETLGETFHQAIGKLQEERIDFGGHTDEHANDQKCGCGAIDKAPESIEHAVRFADKIRGVIEALGVDTEGLDDVQAEYRKYAQMIASDKTYSGREVMDEIIDSGKIVKKLEGEHVEIRIVLNMVSGYTVDQAALRKAAGGKADVFAVDVWRMQQLATQLHTDPTEQHKAFLSELAYTLGVAATLTKGDLPVYTIEAAQVAVAQASV